MNGTELARAYRRAVKRNTLLRDRYNREYLAGKWSTNRPLAGKCEDAYSAVHAALAEYQSFLGKVS